MSDPFTIRVLVADGDPEGVRIVDRMNWTCLAVVFPRERWPVARSRAELGRTGVYILVGCKKGDEDLPTLYIGERDAVADRIDSHVRLRLHHDQQRIEQGACPVVGVPADPAGGEGRPQQA